MYLVISKMRNSKNKSLLIVTYLADAIYSSNLISKIIFSISCYQEAVTHSELEKTGLIKKTKEKNQCFIIKLLI